MAKGRLRRQISSATKRKNEFRARIPRQWGPGRDGRMTRIPRAIVEGQIIGPVSPSEHAMWLWLLGRGIDEKASQQKHHLGFGVVIRIGADERKRAAKVVALLHKHRETTGIEFTHDGVKYRVPLVLSAGMHRAPRGDCGIRVEFHQDILFLIANFKLGYARVDMRRLRSNNSVSKFKSIGEQRLYCLAALYTARRHAHWSMSVEELARIMGNVARRRDNFSAAVEKACSAIAEFPIGKRIFQHAPIYSGKSLVGWEFELVWWSLDISRTGRLEPQEFKNYGESLVPMGWQQCLKRQIDRLERPRRKAPPRHPDFLEHLERTKHFLFEMPVDVRRELELISPRALQRETEDSSFILGLKREQRDRETLEAFARGVIPMYPLYFDDDDCVPLRKKTELEIAEEDREWQDKIARGEDPDPLGTFLAETDGKTANDDNDGCRTAPRATTEEEIAEEKLEWQAEIARRAYLESLGTFTAETDAENSVTE